MTTTKSIHEFSDLMKELTIDVNQLGAVMLPTEPFDIFGDGRDELLDASDLYASNDPAKFWIQGDVSEKAHITLLYGLLMHPYVEPMKTAVDTVLADWERPEYLIPERVTIFPSRDKEEPDYAAIVVEIEDEHLMEAHRRLSYLPHVNTFPEYRAHMTLCYVKLDKAQWWMDILNLAVMNIVVKDGLDYGEDK